MYLSQLNPGMAVIWRHSPSGGWGYVYAVPARVVSVGRVKVTIDAELERGGTKRRSVYPNSLQFPRNAK